VQPETPQAFHHPRLIVAWLDQMPCLHPHAAGVIVPPLPERNVVEKYKMNTGGC
jgi:hypothetical protein